MCVLKKLTVLDFVVWALIIGLLAPSVALGQARSFLNDPVTTPKEYADIIRRCGTLGLKELNLSCDALIESFNRAFGDDVEDVATPEELARFVEPLKVRPCPQNMKTRIARVLSTGEVDLEYARNLRVGEPCLFDPNSGRYISSMICGQWIVDELPVFTAQGERLADSLDDQSREAGRAAGDEGADKIAPGKEDKKSSGGNPLKHPAVKAGIVGGLIVLAGALLFGGRQEVEQTVIVK